MKEPAHLALHPFGQIPTYEEGDLALFESGAIVFHIAERHAGLLPDDAECPGARDRLDVRRAQHGRAADRRARRSPCSSSATSAGTRSACRWSRIASATGWAQLSGRLGDADWLDGAFSAGDLLMVTVLRRLSGIGHARGISEPRRLCRPRRSAARLQARLRRAVAVFTAASEASPSDRHRREVLSNGRLGQKPPARRAECRSTGQRSR